MVTSVGNIASLGSFTSANLASAITNETGIGAAVFATSPTLVTPVLGEATATSINGSTIPSSKTLVVTTDKLDALSATTSSELAGVISDETGTGNVVLSTSPTLTGTPTLPTGTIVVTQTAGNSSTAIATTAFVGDAVSTAVGASVADAINDGTTTIAPSQNAVFDALALKASLASPTLTGKPLAPTATSGTNTTQLATTAFVTNAVSTSGNDFVKLTTNQTIAGNKSFSSDGRFNELTIGRGSGNNATNTVVGRLALANNTSGSENVAIGLEALHKNTTGNANTVVGLGAVYYATSSSAITAFGKSALHAEQGSGNTAIGHEAAARGAVSATLTNSTFLGRNATASNGTIDNATAIGSGATVNASNTIQLGNTSVTNVKTSGTLTAGTVTYPNAHGTANQVLKTNGSGTLSWATSSTPTFIYGTSNTLIDGTASVGSTLTTGDLNSAYGYLALSKITTGQMNTASGAEALYSNDAGSYNTASGETSMRSNTDGSFNTASGYAALYSNSSGYHNIAIGGASLFQNTTGSKNSANGYQTLRFNDDGNENSTQGYQSLYYNTSGSKNVALGYRSGWTNTTGSNNTLIGSSADVLTDNLTNATAIGYNASVAASNTIQLGNTSVNNVKTSGTITAGTVTYPNAHGLANQVLKTDGLGTLAWSTPSSGASGTTNYLSKFTGTTTLGNSLVYDDGTNVGVGTSTPSSLFQIGGETTADLNLKFDRVLNQSAALKIGYRNYQWRMKTETNSGTLYPLNFSYYNSSTDTDVTRLSITNSGIDIPNNLEVVGSTTLQGDVNLNSSLSVNNDQFSVDALTNKVGVLTGSPSSMFQVGGDGNFDNPLRYDYGNSIGTLKFGYRQYEFRMKTATDSGVLTNLIYSYYNSSNDTDVESMRISNSGLVTLNSLKISGGSPGAGKVLTSDASGAASWGSAAATVREVADEFTSTGGETSFILAQTPSDNSMVKMYINGIRISNTAYTWSGTTLTYIPANNGSYDLTASDRVQFDFYY
jgi:carbonic anhydrase/acetyltransferase-like protein (isoleucine patch superfamily)